MTLPLLAPGDVLTVRTHGWASSLIRLGERLIHEPATSNHVVVYIKTDAEGRPWGIEGRPSGTGWCDLSTVAPISTNMEQPKTDAQRALIVAAMTQLLGTSYDWVSIVADAGLAAGTALIDLANSQATTALFSQVQDLWRYRIGGKLIGTRVVCSSAAALAYAHAGTPAPNHGPLTFPSDWDKWNLGREWAK